MTAETETPAGLLRRAADRLDALDQAALDDWYADGRKVCVSHREARRLVIGSFGFEEEAETASALRPLAPLLAAMLRRAADRKPDPWHGHPDPERAQREYDELVYADELAIARVVLAGQGDNRG